MPVCVECGDVIAGDPHRRTGRRLRARRPARTRALVRRVRLRRVRHRDRPKSGRASHACPADRCCVQDGGAVTHRVRVLPTARGRWHAPVRPHDDARAPSPILQCAGRPTSRAATSPAPADPRSSRAVARLRRAPPSRRTCKSPTTSTFASPPPKNCARASKAPSESSNPRTGSPPYGDMSV
jgi:hypothetical protein